VSGGAMRQAPLLLGVDGGGTHTRAVLADTAGRVLGRGESGAANQATSGATAAVRSIVDAVRAACGPAGCDPADIGAACFGLAGLDRPGDEAAFGAAQTELELCVAPHLVNDSVIAWAGATGGEPGVALIAGTGSVAYGRNARGAEHRAGGWGGPFGDEGSAFWIGSQAIARALRGVDGRDAPAPMAVRLAVVAGIEDPADLCLFGRVDRPDGIPMEAAIGALAPAVVACAEAGDADARAILRRAARELADLARAVVAALDLTESRPPVFGLGSVLHRPGHPPTAVADATDRRLRAALGVRLFPPRHSALVGALVLAYTAAVGVLPPPALAADWGRVP